ncbi:MAG: toxin HicA [Candidatus Aminicenantes bacterium]|nr:toxin HicA [Candidatus Aminicenantes bacterium]
MCYLLIVDKGLLENPKNVRFDALLNLCRSVFGEPRVRGSHHIFKTPWPGEPFVNLQRDGKMAKPYQVMDVKRAIEKMEAKHGKQS